MLLDAQKNKYAVAAFNIENMEMAMAVIYTADQLHSPVICAVSQNTLNYANANVFFGIVKSIADSVSIPVALHVDHAEKIEVVYNVLRNGFSSVMIDGSKLPYIDNVGITKKVVEICQIFDIPVEGELGAIGGKEDSLPDKDLLYTKPETALDFVEHTGVSSLAVAIGTAHGIYKNTPCLDYERLTAIRNVVDIPLVLHGASGLSEEQIKECVARGICKINFATELRQAFTSAVKKYLSVDSNVIDPKKMGKMAMEAVSLVVKEKIIQLGSNNRCK